MFKTRLLSGIVLVILALFLIISGHEILLFATLAISCIGMFELYRVFKMEKTVLAGVGYLAAIVYYCNLQWKFLPDLMILFMAFLILLMFVFVFAYPKFHADQVMAAFFGFFYVAVMLSYVYQIRTLERGLYLAFLVFLCSWGCDTCAYCVGMLIGKHKMSPKLSPKKSVEGAVGGVAGAALLTALYCFIFRSPMHLERGEIVILAVIAAIAGGASKANEIATKVGLESAFCAKYLKVLLDLGILKKETPITEKAGRKTVYAIGDNFFRFWYRFVPQNASAITAGRTDKIYDSVIKRHFSDYMGLVYEQMCKEYLFLYAEDLPIILSDIGQWWGNDAKEKKEVQIDIVGTPVEGKEYIIGSCKYRNEPIGVDELELLKHYAEVFGKGEKYHYYIFSKSGFTIGLQSLGNKGEVKLITLQDMYE